MNDELYLSPLEFTILWVVLAVVLAALAGFAIGMIYADNRRLADEAFNPKLRPDEPAKTR